MDNGSVLFELQNEKKEILELSVIGDVLFHVSNMTTLLISANSDDYGVFISTTKDNEYINQYLPLKQSETLRITSSPATCSIIIFIPKSRIGVNICTRKEITHIYALIINNLRNNLATVRFKQIAEINAITALVQISLISSERESTYDKIVAYLKKNIKTEDLSLGSVAHGLFMSKRKLQYILSSNNTTYKKTLNRVRVEALTYYISADPNVSIKKILPLCGFSTQAAASNAFKSEKGVTISQYRKGLQTTQRICC